jgi:hypothetical protein
MSTRSGLDERRSLATDFLIGFISVVAAFFPCPGSFGRSVKPAARLETFHVSGTISRAHDNAALPEADVTFRGEKVSKTLTTDDRGIYEADLPIGSYTMTVRATDISLEVYQRPLFRITRPTSVTFNVRLYTEVQRSCDVMTPPSSNHIPDDNDMKNVMKDECGGWDFIPLPSEDGTPFKLFIRFRTRHAADHGYAYSGRTIFGRLQTPVFVAYNLFTLQANDVGYDERSQTLQASGNVVTVNEDGDTQRADSMKFRIENGQATPLQ